MKLILEWFHVVKKETLSSLSSKIYFEGKFRDWWYSLDKDTRVSKWEYFEKVFICRWKNDT
jgi:hypothetical protein